MNLLSILRMCKKLLLSLVAVLSMLTVSSCDPSESIIRFGVKQANASCPMYLDDGLTMTSVEYSGGYVTYSYECDEDYFDLSVLGDENPTMKRGILDDLRQQARTDKSVKAFLDALKKTQTGLIYAYLVADSSLPYILTIESYELPNL